MIASTHAPATSQRALDLLLSGVKLQYCLIYLDDVIIFSPDEKTHIQHVDYVLTLLREAGVTLKFKKTRFFQKNVEYLGHLIRLNRLEIAMKRIEAFKVTKYRENQTQMR